MLSVFENTNFAKDVDIFIASPERYPKVTSPKSSNLLTPGTTNSSYLSINELSEENAFCFKENSFNYKENDLFTLSHSNSKELNELDFSFVENNQQIEQVNGVEEISRVNTEALISMVSFLNNASQIEMQSCEIYSPLEYKFILPMDIQQDGNEIKIDFKDDGSDPEKTGKKLAKMRLMRTNQESFADHFTRFKEFRNKCIENWNLLEKNPNELKEIEHQISQKSKKCKKTKKIQKMKNENYSYNNFFFVRSNSTEESS